MQWPTAIDRLPESSSALHHSLSRRPAVSTVQVPAEKNELKVQRAAPTVCTTGFSFNGDGCAVSFVSVSIGCVVFKPMVDVFFGERTLKIHLCGCCGCCCRCRLCDGTGLGVRHRGRLFLCERASLELSNSTQNTSEAAGASVFSVTFCSFSFTAGASPAFMVEETILATSLWRSLLVVQKE